MCTNNATPRPGQTGPTLPPSNYILRGRHVAMRAALCPDAGPTGRQTLQDTLEPLGLQVGSDTKRVIKGLREPLTASHSVIE